MRLVRMFGLATLAAVVAMALVGVGPASAAEATQLCNAQHVNGLECPAGQATTTIHIVDTTVGGLVILNSIFNILCLTVEGTASVLGLAAAGTRQGIHATTLLLENCGTNAAHSNCTFTVEILPLFLLLKTSLNLGNLTANGGRIRVVCKIPFELDCKLIPNEAYEAPTEGALHTAGTGHGMVNLVKAPAVLTTGSDLFCPKNITLDGLLEPLNHVWIAS